MRWRVRTGVPWRDLPFEYGPWQTYGLFRRWQRRGVWARLLTLLQARTDAAGLIFWEVKVDSTLCRPCSSSGRRTVSWTPAPGRPLPSWTPPAYGPRPRRTPPPRPTCPLPTSSSQPRPNNPQPALSAAGELSPAQCVLYAGVAGPCAKRSGSRCRSCLCRRRRCR
uniref:Transposase n=1 Tax=Streptomyces sp. NBC_00093 TaxID=2975649 RepID=A0AAU2AH14_9ACTN